MAIPFSTARPRSPPLAPDDVIEKLIIDSFKTQNLTTVARRRVPDSFYDAFGNLDIPTSSLLSDQRGGQLRCSQRSHQQPAAAREAEGARAELDDSWRHKDRSRRRRKHATAVRISFAFRLVHYLTDSSQCGLAFPMPRADR